MYLHTLLLFYKQIHIQPRANAAYFSNHFDANNSSESSPCIVKMVQLVLEIVIKVLNMILLSTKHNVIVLTAIKDFMNRLYDVKSSHPVIYQKLLKSFKRALKVPQRFRASSICGLYSGADTRNDCIQNIELETGDGA